MPGRRSLYDRGQTSQLSDATMYANAEQHGDKPGWFRGDGEYGHHALPSGECSALGRKERAGNKAAEELIACIPSSTSVALYRESSTATASSLGLTPIRRARTYTTRCWHGWLGR